ncbi:3'5'-cyclic nucleotide phosphodiesterase [Nitzschia inconspicua]|uniref:3'5'-cyclic nucleotide phosphodiesterase n=1 Tax=Nitzschia inconspicua TaxID=303405 RepID=A0A9K3LII3_9STRA|nr:3'5'-cyclic nucleotide phosphodiesterase [Nitzschia inconspicua]
MVHVDSLHVESPEQIQRLIDWNVEVLLKLLKKVIAKREACGKSAGWEEEPYLEIKDPVANEVVAVIELPPFDPSVNSKIDDKTIEIPSLAEQQLKDYVTAVAKAYRSNPFSGLQHATHVTNAVTRLVSRIAVPNLENPQIPSEMLQGPDDYDVLLAEHIHTQSYGIACDPLTQFSVVLAALIHAVDHRGLSNEDLGRENPDLADKYNNKSITQQLSLEKAWKKLMEPEFENLRRSLYADVEEKKRFRSVLVNAVMATDQEDEQAQARRAVRWEKSFGPGAAVDMDLNQKATCVIECLMQAADEFHALQTWQVFVKWNERAFWEAKKAFKNGRISTDPAKTWYKDQLAFFDNLIIPLSMKLSDIDAFVINSDEYLDDALLNRQRWSTKGREIVAGLVGKYDNESDTTNVITVVSKEGDGDDDIATRDAAKSTQFSRMVTWNVDVLSRILKEIQAKRQAAGKKNQYLPVLRSPEGKTIADEVVEAIAIPPYDAFSTKEKLDVGSVTLSVPVQDQLHEYVCHICSLFRDNWFHCLDRSTQVSMSAKKLVQRVTTSQNHTSSGKPKEIYEETFGLSDDPLAQFALVFAALIHDIDRVGGVSNAQLVRENSELAKKYHDRCVWEQHAVDLAWNQLMQPEFEDLRECICADEDELKHFRQCVINAVLGTDFTDHQLLELRKGRWERAFGEKVDKKNLLDLKASIVLKLTMQASDSFHALQHWQLFQKWSERHFFELYEAFEAGRIEADPSVYWYKSEMMFFDDHVIPLCKKMQKVSVFGPSADDALAFATTNRDLWATKGADLVQSFVSKYHGKKSRGTRTISQRLSLSG